MRSILIINPKGGCGKTTLATNLASYYAVWNVSTAIVDLDPQESSLKWLDVRPDTENHIQGIKPKNGKVVLEKSTKRIIFDAPAHIKCYKSSKLLKLADVVLIPILQSPIDTRAAAEFVADLVPKIRANNPKAIIGVVANQAQRRYRSYRIFSDFLSKLGVANVGSLRRSQNYIKVAQTGIGIFEMPLAEVKTDMQEWKPILRWIEGKRKLKSAYKSSL